MVSPEKVVLDRLVEEALSTLIRCYSQWGRGGAGEHRYVSGGQEHTRWLTRTCEQSWEFLRHLILTHLEHSYTKSSKQFFPSPYLTWTQHIFWPNFLLAPTFLNFWTQNFFLTKYFLLDPKNLLDPNFWIQIVFGRYLFLNPQLFVTTAFLKRNFKFCLSHNVFGHNVYLEQNLFDQTCLDPQIWWTQQFFCPTIYFVHAWKIIQSNPTLQS